MNVLTVVGARPQFVKAFAVSRVLRRDHDETLVHTGQHYDESLSGVFFEELGVPEPDHQLGVGSGSHGAQTGAMIPAIESVVERESPDAVLVYGDTNSTLAAAVAVSKLAPPLVHVEAGLRSGDRSIPEELNRVLTDHAAEACLAPTETAMAHLADEGLADRARRTGDVMYDAMLWAREHAPDRPATLDALGVDGPYVLATVHRQRNTDDPARLRDILEGLADVPLPVVVPLHPRTDAALREHGLHGRAVETLHLTDPVGYLEFVGLLDGARRVVTDSGGVQKEAFFLDTPCVTLRETTEWPETVEAGYNVLVGADAAAIRRALAGDVALPTPKPTPFGDGDAAERTVDALERLV